MRAMAARAGRGFRSTHLVADAMDAVGVLIGRFFVTTDALGRRQFRIVRGLHDGGMAIDTIEFGMHRLGENFRLHPDPFGGQSLFARFEFRDMAFHAVAVRTVDSLHRRRCDRNHGIFSRSDRPGREQKQANRPTRRPGRQ